jgi:tRNA1Val (adenine37-N6)-methyltransferase
MRGSDAGDAGSDAGDAGSDAGNAGSDAGDAGKDAGDAGKDVTVDSLLKGRVRLYQPARGARMSLDPVLLAGFVVPPFGRFLDIGAGVGPLSFLLLARDPAATGVAVEIQPRLAALASRGRDDNGWRERLEIIEGDVRRLDARVGAAGYDLVVTNPPYRPLHTGNVSPDPERALAHHEVALALGEWLDCAARAVRSGGRVAAILPADRTDELLAALPARGLAPTRLRRVHPLADRPASRILVEAGRGTPSPPRQEPPLIVHADGRRYTPEILAMLGEDG